MARRATALLGAVVALLCLFVGTPAHAAPWVVDHSVRTNYVVLAPDHGHLGATTRAVRSHGGSVLQSWPEIGVVIVESDRPDFAVRLRGAPSVAAVGSTRDFAAKTTSTVPALGAVPKPGKGTAGGDDTREADFDKQWNLRMIGADAAHHVTDGSRSVTVGVLDSGIEAAHPDLAANIDAEQSVGCTTDGVPDQRPGAWQPTTSGHGTHVAGIIAAARNGAGIVGVAPGVKLASIKVVDDSGFIFPEYALCGIVWAAQHRMAVTNNSYLVDPWARWCTDDPDQSAVASALRRALAYSERRGVVSVVSAGNGKLDLTETGVDRFSPNNGTPRERTVGVDCRALPAGVPGVVTVSAVGPGQEKAYYSNYGAGAVTLTAPGGDGWLDWAAERPNEADTIWSTLPDGRYGWLQGTSMAAPHVAGVVALIRSVHPDYRPAQVREVLQQTARPLGCPEAYDYNDDGRADAQCEGVNGAGFYGAGMVDALAAVRAA